MWCLEGTKAVYDNLPTLVNRLTTTVLLVVLLIACQQMPESKNIEGVQTESQSS